MSDILHDVTINQYISILKYSYSAKINVYEKNIFNLLLVYDPKIIYIDEKNISSIKIIINIMQR